ncbi:ABC transporter substrate-binding protein [Comamonadaceae bacterium G21597-S1]|nr:ABC transporter substrate-binding protein [Comamonadaceae bacterium G21597-S1]
MNMFSLTRPACTLAFVAALVAPAMLCAQTQPGTLTMTLSQVKALDPQTQTDTATIFNQINIYDSLYRYRGAPATLAPWLATGHTVSKDGTEVEFTLRDGVKFHDGRVMTAQDVVYSFQRALALKRGVGALFSAVLAPEGITAPSPLTVKFKLKMPYAGFVSIVPTVAILNAQLVKEKEVGGDWGAAWIAANDAGSGAYKLVAGSFIPGERVDLVKFDEHFYGWKDNPQAPRFVQTRGFTEQTTEVMSLLSGRLDVTGPFLSPESIARISSTPNFSVKFNGGARIGVIYLNNTKPPLNNVNFRRCLSYAFNYDSLINSVLSKGSAIRIKTPLPVNMWGQPKPEIGYEFNMAEAKKHCDLAKQEGAPIDRELSFGAITGFEYMSIIGQLLQAEARKLGVTIKVATNTWPNLVTAASKPETSPDLWFSFVNSPFPDPDGFVAQMYESANHGSFKASSYYKNEKVDALLKKAREVQDQKSREPLYQEALKMIVADAPSIFLYEPADARGFSKRASEGFRFTPADQGTDLRWIKLAN